MPRALEDNALEQGHDNRRKATLGHTVLSYRGAPLPRSARHTHTHMITQEHCNGCITSMHTHTLFVHTATHEGRWPSLAGHSTYRDGTCHPQGSPSARYEADPTEQLREQWCTQKPTPPLLSGGPAEHNKHASQGRIANDHLAYHIGRGSVISRGMPRKQASVATEQQPCSMWRMPQGTQISHTTYPTNGHTKPLDLQAGTTPIATIDDPSPSIKQWPW